MRYQGERFSNQRVCLDGNEFDGCRFTNVVFDYSGGPIHLCRCEFQGFTWQFGGDLARGLAVLAQLYTANHPAALAELAKAMFPKQPQANGAAPKPHPSVAAILEAEERDADAISSVSDVAGMDYSRLHSSIKRRDPFASAA